MKKICVCNGQLKLGGIERVLTSYLKALAQDKNLDITLVIKEDFSEKNFFKNEIPENIKLIYVRDKEMVDETIRLAKNKKSFLGKIKYQIKLFQNRNYAGKWYKNFFKENKFDAILDFDSGLEKYTEIKEPNMIMWIHFSIGNLKESNYKKYKRYKTTFAKYKKIIAICDDMKQETLELYPEYKDKFVRLYNPADIQGVLGASQDKSELTKEELELIEKPYIIAASRLNKTKARHELITAYVELKKRGIKEKLYILGEGEERKNLEKQVEELKLQEDVIFLGAKKNPFVWMKNSTLFAHPSYGEGFGLVIIEAMICGVPVVAYDCPTGPKEILDSGKYGVLLKMGDVKGLEDSIYSLLTDEKARVKYTEKYPQRIKDFSLENVREQLYKIIN